MRARRLGALLRLAILLAAAGTACALLDVHYDEVLGKYTTRDHCALFGWQHRPGQQLEPWADTASVALIESEGEHLRVGALSADGQPTLHGQDVIVAQLLLPSTGAITRLIGRHVRDNVYEFPGWGLLEAGAWTANFTLWTTATTDLPPLADVPRLSSLVTEGFTCARTLLASVESVRKLHSAAPQGPLPTCTAPAKGRWVPQEQRSGACSQEHCSGGRLEDLLVNEKVQHGRGFNHVYVPYSCTYRLYSREEAAECLTRRRVAFVGDSLLRYFRDQVAWFTQHEVEYWRAADRVGLPVMLHEPERLRRLLAEYDVVVFDSLLHDIIPFENDEQAALKDKYGLRNVTRTHAGGRNELEKHYPVRAYLDGVQALCGVLANATGAKAQLFWLMEGGRMTSMKNAHECTFHNQVHVQLCVQELLVQALQDSGITPLDFTYHTHDAPAEWFDDYVHYGKQSGSGLKLTSLQILLNMVCGMQAGQ